MPIRYEWTPEQQQQAEAANQWLMDAIAKAMPGSAYLGQETYQPVAQPIANALLPKTLEDAMNAAFNTIGVGPLEIYPNYRTPEAIQGLRRLMAEEQRARGPMASKTPPNYDWQTLTQEWSNPPYSMSNRAIQDQIALIKDRDLKNPDPADLILRGTWFHGESPAARREVALKIPMEKGGDIAQMIPRGAYEGSVDYGYSLPATNQYGFPGSTHAIPGGYVRFGEPYGVSLTASPSIAAKFAADENIHRVMPLYGGPPTERTLQLWKPEHQKRFNEAYNETFNKFLQTNPHAQEDLSYLLGSYMRGEEGPILPYALNENPIMEYYVRSQGQPRTEKFNIMFSDALQNQGVRGLLYNPRRYGEYEMLMLDPKWAQPLDYRPVKNYELTTEKYGLTALNPHMGHNYTPGSTSSQIMTPGTAKGYTLAQPEFAANHARLSDMFGLMPWTERINPENWQRIMEQVDPAYRDAIVNQLFGNR